MWILLVDGQPVSLDSKEKVADAANMARESLKNMSGRRIEQIDKNLSWCWLHARCEQVWRWNINIGWQEWYLKTWWAWINTQKASPYLSVNNINSGLNRINNEVNRFNINARVGSSVARWPWTQNIVWWVWWY